MDKCKQIINYFPNKIKYMLNKINDNEWKRLNEINFINGQAVIIQINAKRLFLSPDGTTIDIDHAYKTNDDDIKAIFELITKSSVYAYNRFINEGFLTLAGGHRVGVIGNCVMENKNIISINGINALCFRITHNYTNNASLVYDEIYTDKKILNTIIISPPGCGKTTLLRGLSSKLGKLQKNGILLKCAIIDERYEIAACDKGVASMDVGYSSVIISGCNKDIAIPMVVRSMAPDVILTDELSTSNDIVAIKYAKASGCSVVATVHGYDEKNNELSNFDASNIFDKSIVLSSRKGPGTIEKILCGEPDAY